MLTVTGQEVLGGPDQALLLVMVHGGQGAAMAAVLAPANLGEHQGIAIQHDQIDLALPITDIAFQQGQPPVLQPACGQLFRPFAGVRGYGVAAAREGLFMSGLVICGRALASPLMKTAQFSSRIIR